MMRSIILATWLLLLLSVVLALPIYAKPTHFYTDKKWWVGEAVIGAAVFLDMHSTSRMLYNGNRELNPILGPHPSDGRIAAFGVGAFTYWTAFHALDWKFLHDDPGKGWRFMGYTAMPVAALAVHLPPAIHNYELPAAEREGIVLCHLRPGQPCQ